MVIFYFLFSLVFIQPLSANEITANETLSTELAKEFGEAFVRGVERYNKSRKDLPSIRLNQQGVAEINLEKGKISFSADNLLQGYVFLNEEKLFLKTVSPQDVEAVLKKKEVSFTSVLLNLIIANAYAEKDFEKLVFKTVIGIKTNFKDFSCWLDKCKVEQFKHNFDKVMNEIKKNAQACKTNVNGQEMKDFVYKLREQLEYQSSQWYFEQNLEKYFKNLGTSEVTCQRFVETAFRDELEDLSKNNIFSRYLDTTTVEAYEGRNSAEKRFNAFVSQQCAPYVELRDCLISQRRGDGAQIYNRLRDHGKEVPASKKYEITPRSKVRKQ